MPALRFRSIRTTRRCIHVRRRSPFSAPKGGSHCRHGWISNSRQIRSYARAIRTFSEAWDLKTSRRKRLSRFCAKPRTKPEPITGSWLNRSFFRGELFEPLLQFVELTLHILEIGFAA